MSKELLIEDKKDVLEAISDMKERFPTLRSKDSLLLIEKEVDAIRFKLNNNLKVVWAFHFSRLGSRMMNLIIGFDQDELATLLIQKHTKYGPSALTKWGEMGILIRIDSKLQRAKNLALMVVADMPNETDESFADTMNDIVGYCVLGYVMTTRKKI